MRGDVQGEGEGGVIQTPVTQVDFVLSACRNWGPVERGRLSSGFF